MLGRTHAAVGANAVWIVAVFGTVDSFCLWIVLIGALAGLFADIDSARAKIHSVAGGLFGAFRSVARHRGFTHSLLCLAIVSLISILALPAYHPLLPHVVIAAYASHMFLDGLTYSGVQFLWPFERDIRLLPYGFRFKTGGGFDQLLFFLSIFSLLFFFLTYQDVFLTYQNDVLYF